MGKVEGGMKCVKYLLFIFNFIFWVSRDTVFLFIFGEICLSLCLNEAVCCVDAAVNVRLSSLQQMHVASPCGHTKPLNYFSLLFVFVTLLLE